MLEEEIAPAPVLSTYQDDITFSYDKVRAQEKLRPHLKLKNNKDDEEVREKIGQYYSLKEMVEFLSQKDGSKLKYERITLQFPDSLICDSATIVHELQRMLKEVRESQVEGEGESQGEEQEVDIKNGEENGEISDNREKISGTCQVTETKSHKSESLNKCGCGKETSCQEVAVSSASPAQKLWILADTSYSPCCVDEVAAAHVMSDLVIHFGNACLNVIDKLPAVYVFGKPYADIDEVIRSFKLKYNKNDKVVLMADAPSTYILHELYNSLKEEYKNLIYADLYIDSSSSASIIGYTPHTSTQYNALNRTFIGFDNIQDLDEALLEHDIFHISDASPDTPRLLQLTTKFKSVTLYDTTTNIVSQGPFPSLMRRYRYMHMARTAGTIGLLVNTLSLANTKKLINSIGKKIKDAGKKHYIFVVGKPNVAKLANFENIDMWCILGCDHQGIIIDQTNEYFKPIVTPYELLLALNDELTWSGKWETDFKKLLRDMEEEDENKVDLETSDDDEPEFNPVTGKYVSTSRPLRQLHHLQITSQEEDDDEDDSKSLVKKFSSTVAIKNTVSTSAVHLQNRHWTGLGSDFQNDNSDEEYDPEEGALLEKGRGGVARGYDYDIEHKLVTKE
jgi:diphthamide biosynthesis protein 2